MNSITLDLNGIINLTDEQFYQLAIAHRDLRMERTRTGEIIIMPPTGGETGDRESDLNFQLRLWNERAILGKVFSSSTGFKLPNGAVCSPDATWIRLERWEALTLEQRKKFPPLCPDFAIELRSSSDRLAPLQEKMQEYIDNGLRLGWLIDPRTKVVHIYRIGQEVEVLQSPTTLSGEDVLPGFTLNLKLVFA